MTTAKRDASNSARKLPCGRPRPPAHRSAIGPAQIEALRARLDKYLAENQLKQSEQRWKIARLILGSTGHMSAQQLVRQVQAEHPEIGPATVYRNIKVLCDARILKETLIDAEDRVVYEPFEDEHHDHIICSDCGQIFEFHDKRIEAAQERIVGELGFEEQRHRHVIYARCKYRDR